MDDWLIYFISDITMSLITASLESLVFSFTCLVDYYYLINLKGDSQGLKL